MRVLGARPPSRRLKSVSARCASGPVPYSGNSPRNRAFPSFRKQLAFPIFPCKQVIGGKALSGGMLIMDRLVRFLLVAWLFAAPALAQDRLEPAKLPPDTAFYLYWRGLASQSQWSHVNSLLALWNDPDFLPFRAALAEGVFSIPRRRTPGSN